MSKSKCVCDAGCFFSLHLLTHIAVFADSFKAQVDQQASEHDLRIMESISPDSKRTMAKNMAELRMKEMQRRV